LFDRKGKTRDEHWRKQKGKKKRGGGYVSALLIRKERVDWEKERKKHGATLFRATQDKERKGSEIHRGGVKIALALWINWEKKKKGLSSCLSHYKKRRKERDRALGRGGFD